MNTMLFYKQIEKFNGALFLETQQKLLDQEPAYLVFCVHFVEPMIQCCGFILSDRLLEKVWY